MSVVTWKTPEGVEAKARVLNNYRALDYAGRFQAFLLAYELPVTLVLWKIQLLRYHTAENSVSHKSAPLDRGYTGSILGKTQNV